MFEKSEQNKPVEKHDRSVRLESSNNLGAINTGDNAAGSPVDHQDRSVRLESSSNSGLINTGDVYVNKRVEITDDMLDMIASKFNKSNIFALARAGTNSRTTTLMKGIKSGLEARGFVLGAEMEFPDFPGLELDQPITICPNGFQGEGFGLGGGSQLIIVDAGVQPR